MKCKFDEKCPAKLEVSNAWVPGIQSLCKAIGRAVKVEDLHDHTFCGRHAHSLRDEGVKMFSYVSTFDEIEKRGREREQERATASKFSTMYVALKAAGIKSEPKKQKVRKPRVAKAKAAVVGLS